jgi:hypothetical protein
MDEIGVSRGAAKRPGHRSEHHRSEPRLAPKPGHDSSGAAEAPEVLGPHDGDLDTAGLQPLDQIGDEPSGEVPLAARVGRREDGDLQGEEILRRDLDGLAGTVPGPQQ